MPKISIRDDKRVVTVEGANPADLAALNAAIGHLGGTARFDKNTNTITIGRTQKEISSEDSVNILNVAKTKKWEVDGSFAKLYPVGKQPKHVRFGVQTSYTRDDSLPGDREIKPGTTKHVKPSKS